MVTITAVLFLIFKVDKCIPDFIEDYDSSIDCKN